MTDFQRHVALVMVQDKIPHHVARIRAWLEREDGYQERLEREKYRRARALD